MSKYKRTKQQKHPITKTIGEQLYSLCKIPQIKEQLSKPFKKPRMYGEKTITVKYKGIRNKIEKAYHLKFNHGIDPTEYPDIKPDLYPAHKGGSKGLVAKY